MSELAPELLSLLTLVVATLIALVEKVRRDLKSNTLLTQETKTAANGTLTDALTKLAAEQRLLIEAATPDDPTGTDAFAHPGC